MVAKYGVTFLGWIFVFAALQIWYNQEIGRYTVATGEGILTGLYRLSPWIGWITIILVTTIFSWVGGYAGAAGSAIYSMTGFPQGASEDDAIRIWAFIVVIMTIVVVFIGPSAYRVIEIVESFAAITAFGGLLIVVLLSPAIHSKIPEYVTGLVSFDWPPFPGWSDEDYVTWGTLIAYTGAGGIWNLAYSYWVREKGYGQARHVSRVTSPLSGAADPIPEVGYDFVVESEEDVVEWRHWIRWLWTDNLLGVTLNTLTIILTTLLTFSLILPEGIEISRDFTLVEAQGLWMEGLYGVYGRLAVLVIAFLFLFDVYLIAGDLFSRFMAEVSYTIVKEGGLGERLILPKLLLLIVAPVFLVTWLAEEIIIDEVHGILRDPYSAATILIYSLSVAVLIYFGAAREIDYRRMYYLSWIVYIAVSVPQILGEAPGSLILVSGAANAVAMALLMTATMILSFYKLPRIHGAGNLVRQSTLTFGIEVVIAIVFWILSIWLAFTLLTQ